MTGMKKSLTAEIFESADTCCYNPLEMLPTSLGITDTGKGLQALGVRLVGLVSSAPKPLLHTHTHTPIRPAVSSVRECMRWRLDVPAPAAEKATLSAAPRLHLARTWTRGGGP